MAPEIVDLISDDEDEVVPVAGPSSNTHRRAGQQVAPDGTINPALILPTRASVQIVQADTPSSTPSSHTAHNSLEDETPRSILSPLFVPSRSPGLEAHGNDKGKGKGRAASIPEIDLSQDTNDDENTPSPPGADSSWDYANGEFTEEDALKQAIALSLQEQSPPQGHGHDQAGGEGEAHTLKAAVEPIPLPDWRSSSPLKYPVGIATATATTIAPAAPSSLSSSSDAEAQAKAQPPTVAPNSTKAAPSPGVGVPASNSTDKRAVDQNQNQHQRPPTYAHSPPNTFSLAGLDRKSMEAARLARLKRKHGQGETQEEQDGEGPNPKVAKTTRPHQVGKNGTISPPPIRNKKRTEDLDSNNDKDKDGGITTGRWEGPHNSLPRDTVSPEDGDSVHHPTATCYLDGIVLKTYVPGYPAAQTISFESLISPSSHLESALLSSFNWNLDWLFPHFETRRTKFQLVMHAKSSAQRESIVKDWQGVPNVRLTFPPMDGNVNCMHSKLMLLFYTNEGESVWKGGQRCRIVIPTANLVDFDWGVGAFIENMVWLIDLPLRETSTTAGRTEPPFQTSLKQFLKAQTVPDDVLRKLDQFDFSRTAKYGFVHSIGGVHTGQAWRMTGIGGLGHTVTELGLATRDPIQLDYVTSSVGSLNDDFMNSMYLAAQGDSGMTEYTRRLQKKAPSGDQQSSWKENFRFYFPSDETVRASKGGPQKAGTICFSTKWWQNPSFPRSNMVDCFSVRERLLMHIKVCHRSWQ
ncbi:hypothetical protein, variant [Phialophora macrospora]|uniref:Uncharacterized protein n=1 Tax=Phialophora macrospora TaxID=1851006 RepID=A0A0D2G2T5_9EURO|nr:hypothetical protein, variant [Phialophora macrospora]